MLNFRCEDPLLRPAYQTEHSAGADLRSAIDMTIPSGQFFCIPTGVYLLEMDAGKMLMPTDLGVPELQIRARSGLAAKHQITLMNGVGTIDADYRDEIKVMLWNAGPKDFVIKKYDRIAQLVLAIAYRLPDCLVAKTKRVGGFGSTSVSDGLIGGELQG